mgnify:FL=1
MNKNSVYVVTEMRKNMDEKQMRKYLHNPKNIKKNDLIELLLLMSDEMNSVLKHCPTTKLSDWNYEHFATAEANLYDVHLKELNNRLDKYDDEPDEPNGMPFGLNQNSQ